MDLLGLILKDQVGSYIQRSVLHTLKINIDINNYKRFYIVLFPILLQRKIKLNNLAFLKVCQDRGDVHWSGLLSIHGHALSRMH